MRLFLTLAALLTLCGSAVAAEKYHLVNDASVPINDQHAGLSLVCVEPDVAKKIMVNGKYNRKIWAVPGAQIPERMAAEWMPYSGTPVLVSADCLEKLVAAFKKNFPDRKLQIHDIAYPD